MNKREHRRTLTSFSSTTEMARVYLQWARCNRKDAIACRRRAAESRNEARADWCRQARQARYRAVDYYRVAWSIARTTRRKLRLLRERVTGSRFTPKETADDAR